jgi:hypothetical protein
MRQATKYVERFKDFLGLPGVCKYYNHPGISDNDLFIMQFNKKRFVGTLHKLPIVSN